MRHLLVTNDFPPKTGGIQTYLWELWRRLPPGDTTVLTSPHAGSARFDAEQPFRIERTRQPVLLPEPALRRHVHRLAAEVGASLVVLDPALPLGMLGPSLDLPYAVVLHGSEVTVPGRLPGGRQLLTRVLRHASLVVAAGGYPESEARRAAGGRPLPPVVRIPPGVDTSRFVSLPAIERARARARLRIDPDATVVLSLSRLVPRKGMDTLVAAGALLAPTHPGLQILIGGTGRDQGRLQRMIATTGSPARLLGWVADADLPDVYAAADLFVLCCRDRWAGLEQEGFGIIFLEAASAGLASVAGRSGGSAEAVADGETGIVVDHPSDPVEVAAAMERLLDDPALRARLGAAARVRAGDAFDYDRLAARLADALAGTGRDRAERPPAPDVPEPGALGQAWLRRRPPHYRATPTGTPERG